MALRSFTSFGEFNQMKTEQTYYHEDRVTLASARPMFWILIISVALMLMALSACAQVQPVKDTNAVAIHQFAVQPPPFNAGTGFNFYEVTASGLSLMLTNQPWNGSNPTLINVPFNSTQKRFFTAETTNALTGEAAQYAGMVGTNSTGLASIALPTAAVSVIK